MSISKDTDTNPFYVIAYRTPLWRVKELSVSNVKYDHILSPVLQFLENFTSLDLQVRQMLFSNCFSQEMIRSYSFRRILCNYPNISNRLRTANICYIDNSCLSAFTGLLLSYSYTLGVKEIDIYIGYEDLGCGREQLLNAAKTSPEQLKVEDICREIAKKYSISHDMAQKYIKEQVKIKNNSFEIIFSHILDNYHNTNKTSTAVDTLDTENLIQETNFKTDLGHPPYLARFSKGAGVIICTSDLELAKQYNGLCVHSIACYSNIGNPIENSHILQSMELALSKANLSWHDISAFEIYDGFLVLTLSVIKVLQSKLKLKAFERINILGNAIVRGDPVSAVGILMLTNAESAFNSNMIPNNAYMLITGYSTTIAISLVVSKV
ncbi:MAG: hypothetical protein ABDH37_08485 [Candidatus Hydrothermales bacterium]